MSLAGTLRRRLNGDYVVDAWGLDTEVFHAAMAVGRIRWSIDVRGIEHVPENGPALLVVERHLGVSEQTIVATAISSHTHRRVRSAGVPGVRFVEAPLRKLGAALAHPDEISGLLRDGHVVSVSLAWSPYGEGPGAVDARLVAPVLPLGVPVLPVATKGREWGRRWSVVIGKPLPAPSIMGHLGAVELAEGARAEVGRIHQEEC